MKPYIDFDGNSAGHLAIYLAENQKEILIKWRAACEENLPFKGSVSLTRKQFINKVPALLGVLGLRLKGIATEVSSTELAAEHGLHRWQKGYALSDLSAEMNQLNRILLSELRIFFKLSPSDNDSMAFSYEQVSDFGNEINTGSITQYADLQRKAAVSRTEALQKTLGELNEIGKQRSDLLRHSSHDLRGSFTALQGVASLLEMVNDSDQERRHLLEILRRNLVNCRTLVTQLMDLARLEAGQEVLQIKQIDAGQLLTELVASYQPLAKDRGLALKAQGPTSLPVDCDPVHLQRIVQNLVLNALKHTGSGWVSVSWMIEEDAHWTVHVQDSGPGLPAPIRTDLVDQSSATSFHSEEALKLGTGGKDYQDTVIMQAANPAFSYKGEGIGLSIVKGLCELLKAGLDIESKRGEGTTFRIRLKTYW